MVSPEDRTGSYNEDEYPTDMHSSPSIADAASMWLQDVCIRIPAKGELSAKGIVTEKDIKKARLGQTEEPLEGWMVHEHAGNFLGQIDAVINSLGKEEENRLLFTDGRKLVQLQISSSRYQNGNTETRRIDSLVVPVGLTLKDFVDDVYASDIDFPWQSSAWVIYGDTSRILYLDHEKEFQLLDLDGKKAKIPLENSFRAIQFVANSIESLDRISNNDIFR